MLLFCYLEECVDLSSQLSVGVLLFCYLEECVDQLFRLSVVPERKLERSFYPVIFLNKIQELSCRNILRRNGTIQGHLMLQRIWMVGNVITYSGENSFDLEQFLARARKIKIFAETVGNSRG